MFRNCHWIGLFALSLLSACVQHFDTGEVLPKPEGPPPMISRASQIAVTTSVPLATIQAALDRAIPGSLHVEEQVHVLIVHIPIKGNVDRGPISLTPAPPGINFHSALNGHGSAPSNWDVGGQVSGSLQPVLDSGYYIHSNIHVDPSFQRAEMFHIHFASWLTDHFRGATAGVAPALDHALNERTGLREKAQKLWTSAFGALRLPGTAAPVYLVHTPQQILLANPVVTPDGQVRFGLGVSGNLQVVAGTQPAEPAPIPLPDAQLRPSLDNGFALDVPIVIDMASLGEAFNQALQQGQIRLERGSLKVRSVEAAVSDGKLQLRLGVSAGHFWHPSDGALFIEAEPYLDESDHVVALRRVEFTVQTRNVLTTTAGQILSPLLVHAIQSRARLPLTPLESQAREAANHLAAQLGQKSGGLVSVSVDSIRVASVAPVSGYLVVDVLAHGTVDAHFPPPATP